MQYVLVPTVKSIDIGNNIVVKSNITDLKTLRREIKRIYGFGTNVYTEEEVDEKAAEACTWAETASADQLFEGECFTIKTRAEYRVYYTLRTGKFPNEKHLKNNDGEDITFSSFEEAYDRMCREYMQSLTASTGNPSGLPVRYGIWRTAVCGKNSTSQAVWTA